MADEEKYEVLRPGGHANLIAALKAYFRKPNSVGTSQIIDGSVIDDKLDPDGVRAKVDQIENDLANVSIDVDDLGLDYDEDESMLYVTYRDVRSENGIPATFGGGGSGGGSGNNATLSVTNTTGWLSATVSSGASCALSLTWSSLEDGLATGDGTLTVTVAGVVRRTLDVAQGSVSVDVGSWLSTGTSKVKLRLTDTYGNSKTITFTITAVELSVRSSFDTSGTFVAGQAIDFTYTPVGAVEKTVYFVVDGQTEDMATVTTSGRQQTQTLRGLSHGAHTLMVYFTAEIDGQLVRSNELYFSLVVVDPSSSVPIVATSFRDATATQYQTLSIPYTVYTPTSLTSEVTLSANGTQVASLTVDRTEHTWSYRCDATGPLALAIASGTASKSLSLTVGESDVDAHAETDALALHLTSYGRSSSEAHPEVWQDTDNNVSCTLTGFNFVSDGWVTDSDGITVLRVAGDARVAIPYQPFAQDFRSTGKTLEVEFATRNILDYDATLISCMSGGRGFSLTAQRATLASEQSEISTQYKEDEHVRIAFVAEKRTEHRLLYIYINGIMSGVVQYPDDDDFSQVNPVGISIGSNSCTTDVYRIRVYDNDLTRYQVLDNWIADTQDVATMLSRYEHNDVYDEYGQVTIENLPDDLPYMVMSCAELPQYKGDKKAVSGYFVDPSDSSRSFSFTGAQADVQGTSSQYYPRKNYKVKFNGGFTMTATGQTASTFAMRATSVPTKTFTLKADVASSEGANNVELVRLYDSACPYRTPPQELDSRVRQGIDGFPMVLFWDDGTDMTFVGKYNFNNDKGTPEVFGFASGDESWEIKNNTGNRVLFKSADFSGSDWLNDFEARYPDTDPAYTDATALSALAAWLASTDQTAATGDALASPYTDLDGNTHTVDNAAYRLAKFRTEAADYLEMQSALFYYLFTELFLMVDSRAKNAFPSFLSGDKWCWLPYDFDTAIGINNEGSLAFDYSLEDTDTTAGGADVFNGQQSVMWVNLRMGFPSELAAMYQSLRSTGAISYAVVESMFEAHQDRWPEAIFNEDAWFKYIDPLTEDGSGAYLAMAQGSKAEQRKWWLYNRFRYIDSKYNAGDALTDVIQLRGYAKANVTVTPYADIYPAVKFGSYLVTERGQRNVSKTLVCPLDNVNDTEIYVYSASQLASVGDLSGLKVGFADFSMATRLQSIKVGDSAQGYENGNLTTLTVGNNALLGTVDARNCTALAGTVDLSGAANIEHVYLAGTAVTSVSLPVGGILKTLQLPATVTNLTVRDQPSITSFSMASYASVTTLRVENCGSAIPVLAILAAMPANSRVRIIGFTMSVSTTQDVEDFFDYLDTMRGLDESGNNVAKAVVSGTLTGIDSVTGAWLAEMAARYPDVTITYNHITSNLYYYNYDGTELLHTESITDGGDGTWNGAPNRAATAANTYTFAGWSTYTNQTAADPSATQAVTADRSVYAAYTVTGRTYTVRFYNGSTLLQTVNSVPYGGSATYTGSTPVDPDGEEKEFTGWQPAPTNIQGDTSCYAQYASPEPEHTITDTWEQIIAHVNQGDYATRYSVGDTMSLNLGSEGYINMQIAGFDVDDKASGGKAAISWISEELLKTTHRMNPARAYNTKLAPSWSVSNDVWTSQNLYAVSTAKVTLTLSITEAGTLSINYKTSNSNASRNRIATLTVNGETIATNYTNTTGTTYTKEVVAGDTVTIYCEFDQLTDSYNYYGTLTLSGVAFTTQAAIEDAETRDSTSSINGTGAIGGWEYSEMREYLKETIKPLIPAEVRSAIKEVTKTQPSYDTAGSSVSQTTTDDVWIPSYEEMFGSTSKYYDLFQNTSDKRIKQRVGTTSATSWWLRTAYSTTNFRYVYSGGSYNNYNATITFGVALGFSI